MPNRPLPVQSFSHELYHRNCRGPSTTEMIHLYSDEADICRRNVVALRSPINSDAARRARMDIAAHLHRARVAAFRPEADAAVFAARVARRDGTGADDRGAQR
jgi:hypothetical protein